MIESTILLKTPTVLRLPLDASVPRSFDRCALTWQEEALIVTPQGAKISFPALQNRAWLQDCLERSPVRQVCLDPTLTESAIKAWADIAAATGKQVYLKVPDVPGLPQMKQPKQWWVKRLIDWLAAALLLTVLSPVMLVLAVLVPLDSSGPITFHQWRVGAGGRLFRIYKFRSMYVDAEARHHEVMGNQVGLHKLEQDPRVTRLGRWLRKLSLDELPQLVNVLRGEMSLVGPRPWALYDAVRIAPELQGRLNAMPGITGPWQVSTRSNELDLYAVTCRDLAYLQHWNIFKDLEILLSTIPKVLFGTGAF